MNLIDELIDAITDADRAEDARSGADGLAGRSAPDRAVAGLLDPCAAYVAAGAWDYRERLEMLVALRYGRWDGETDDVEVRR